MWCINKDTSKFVHRDIKNKFLKKTLGTVNTVTESDPEFNRFLSSVLLKKKKGSNSKPKTYCKCNLRLSSLSCDKTGESAELREYLRGVKERPLRQRVW